MPDLRGRTAIGAGLGSDGTVYRLGGEYGAEEIFLTEENLAAHSHGVPAIVPLPAAFPLLLVACTVLGLRRRGAGSASLHDGVLIKV